jgi:hypothetical protein
MRGPPLVLFCFLAAFPAAAQTLLVRPEVCAALTELPPDPGVAFTPGIDVSGRPVAPADLPSGRWVDDVVIPLSVDLKRRLGIKLEQTLFPLGAELGYVTVVEGRAYLNGEPLATGSENALAALCRHAVPQRWQDPPR